MIHYHRQLIDGNNFECFEIYNGNYKIGWLRKEPNYYYLNIFYRDYRLKASQKQAIPLIIAASVTRRDTESVMKPIREAMAEQSFYDKIQIISAY